MRRVVAVLLALLASGVSAQTTITPGGGSGSSTITSGSTVTSGCVAGGVLRSISNMVDCGAGLTFVGGVLTAGTATTAGASTLVHRATISGASATSNFLNITGTLPATLSAETNAMRWAFTGNSQDQTQRGAYLTLAGSAPTNVHSAALEVENSSTGYFQLGIVGRSTGAPTYSLGVYGISAGAGGSNAGVIGVIGGGASVVSNAAVVATNSAAMAGSIFQGFMNTTKVFEVGPTGSTLVGGSGLGSTIVPLTARLGTGSTANVFEMQNSAGTVLYRFQAGGHPVSVTAIPAVSNTSANSCGTDAATIAGTSETGIITVGATSGTSCTVTFPVAAPTRRQCVINNETTANLARAVYSSATVSLFEGTFVGGDVISYICQVY